MARRARRNHSPAFKAKAALAAIKGEKTMSELAQQPHPEPVEGRRPRQSDQAMARSVAGRGYRGFQRRKQSRTTGACGRREDPPCEDWRSDTGQRFFGRRARQGGPSERKAMIDRKHDLPVSRQARELGISRGSIYYLLRATSAADLVLMRRIVAPTPRGRSQVIRSTLTCCASCR